MCYSTRHICPGGRALCGDEFSDIVECHYIASIGLSRLLACYANRKIALAAIAVDGHLILSPSSRLSSNHDIRQLRQQIHQRFSERLFFAPSNELFRRAIENAHSPAPVDADNPGARAREYCFHEATTAVDEVTCLHDGVMLRAQFLSHAIEGLAKMRQIAFGLTHRHAHI